MVDFEKQLNAIRADQDKLRTCKRHSFVKPEGFDAMPANLQVSARLKCRHCHGHMLFGHTVAYELGLMHGSRDIPAPSLWAKLSGKLK